MTAARTWLFQKWVNHMGELWRIQRATTAMGNGLPAAEFAQSDPGSSVTVNQTSTSNTVTQPPPSPTPSPPAPAPAPAPTDSPATARSASWKSVLTSAALALGSAGAATGITAAIAGKQSPATPAAQTVIDKQTITDKKVDPIELELQWWTDENGKVHFGPPTPGKPANPGTTP